MKIRFGSISILELNKQEWFAFSISYMVSFLGILSSINSITEGIGFHTILDTIICYGILYMCVISSWIILFKYNKFRWYDLTFIFLFLLIFFLSYVFNEANSELFFTNIFDIIGNPFYLLFIYSVPGYLIVRGIDNFEIFKIQLVKLSYITVVLSCIVFFKFQDSNATQYMTLSYNMLLQVMCIILCDNAKKLYRIITIILGCFVICFGGARGALLGLLLGLGLYILILKKQQIKKKIIIFLILAFILCIISLIYKELILEIQSFLKGLGISSRSIDMLLTSDFYSSKERDIIFKTLKSNISLLGSGMYADRVMLQEFTDYYAHNLFLEWFIDYGIIIGFILSSVFICLVIIAIKKSDKAMRSMLIVFFPNALIKLLLSSSYLAQEPAFYIFIGLCINTISLKKIIVEKR